MDVEKRVLIVEDEAPLRRSLESFLSRAGYSFISCATAHDALMLAENIRPDIVISEYHLPDGNGSTLFEKLMRIVPGAAMIMISEFDFQVIASDLLRVNIQSFLKKPFDVVELETALSFARSKASNAGVTIKWKRDLFLERVPASLIKQGTLRGSKQA